MQGAGFSCITYKLTNGVIIPYQKTRRQKTRQQRNKGACTPCWIPNT